MTVVLTTHGAAAIFTQALWQQALAVWRMAGPIDGAAFYYHLAAGAYDRPPVPYGDIGGGDSGFICAVTAVCATGLGLVLHASFVIRSLENYNIGYSKILCGNPFIQLMNKK